MSISNTPTYNLKVVLKETSIATESLRAWERCYGLPMPGLHRRSALTGGFIFEASGDWQLARFKADRANKGKPLTSGLWNLTRHPNYFGDAVQENEEDSGHILLIVPFSQLDVRRTWFNGIFPSV